MKSLTKQYQINASSEEVYKALTDPSLIEKWSGQPAEMDIKPSGKFSLWGGSIQGINKETSKNKITQDWQEKNWEKPSKVTFNIREENGTTYLELIHDEISEDSFNNIDNGWDEYYLGPLKKMLESET